METFGQTCDSLAGRIDLLYIRTKDGADVDFVFSESGELEQLIECKLSDNMTHRVLARFAVQLPDAAAIQIVYYLQQEEFGSGITNVEHWACAVGGIMGKPCLN